MDSYKRDASTAEQEQIRDGGSVQSTGWLSGRLSSPLGVTGSGYAGRVAHRLKVLYRRASTRTAGLVVNTLEGLRDLAPGRT